MQDIPESALQPLTPRDKALIRTLKEGALSGNESWANEVDGMMVREAKAEIEALFELVGIAGFSSQLAHSIIHREYLE